MKAGFLAQAAALALVLLQFGCATEAAGDREIAAMPLGQIQVGLIQGDVELVDAKGATSHALKQGEAFTEGNIVKAMPGASALLVFSNGAVVKIFENSQLAVLCFRQDAFDGKREGSFLGLNKEPSKSITELDVREGTILGQVNRLDFANMSRFSVNTPAGSARADGTVFSATIFRNHAGQVTAVIFNSLYGNAIFHPVDAVTAILETLADRAWVALDVNISTGWQMQVNLTVDPVAGTVVGGGASCANIGRNAAIAIISSLYESINAARQLNDLPAAMAPVVGPNDIAPSLMVNDGRDLLALAESSTVFLSMPPSAKLSTKASR